MQQTLIVLKPDAVSRGLCGEILARFERRGFVIAQMKLLVVSKELAQEHYVEHAQKPFFPGLVEFITSSPSLAMVLEGGDVITLTRAMIGATSPLEANPATIRGTYTSDKQLNLVHGSDSPEAAAREIKLWFG